MADVQKDRVSFPGNVQAKSKNRKRCRCVGRAHSIYIPSRQVDDRHLLMTIPTPYWYCLNKYELLQTSQSSDTKKPNGSKFWPFFFSECVRYGNTSLHSWFVIGNPSLANVPLRCFGYLGLVPQAATATQCVAEIWAWCLCFVSILEAVVWVSCLEDKTLW